MDPYNKAERMDELFLAIYNNESQHVDQLLEQNPQWANQFHPQLKESAVHLCSQLGHVETMAVLVQRGGDLGLLNSEKETPLELAVKSHRGDLVKWMVDQQAPWPEKHPTKGTLLHMALANPQDTKTVEVVISHTPADQINAQDAKGRTAMHWAAYHNKPEVVRDLNSRGAFINIADKNHQTPLIYACMNDSIHAVETLIHRRAIAHTRDMQIKEALNHTQSPRIKEVINTHCALLAAQQKTRESSLSR